MFKPKSNFRHVLHIGILSGILIYRLGPNSGTLIIKTIYFCEKLARFDLIFDFLVFDVKFENTIPRFYYERPSFHV